MCPLVPPQSAEQIAALCRSFDDAQADGMEGGARDSQDPPPRPLARHLSEADRLRKVIQELVDTEKSYVKVGEEAARPSRPVFPSAVASRRGRGGVPQTRPARAPAGHEGDALAPWRKESLQRRQGRVRGWECVGDPEKIRFSAPLVAGVAFAMETCSGLSSAIRGKGVCAGLGRGGPRFLSVTRDQGAACR